MRSTNGAVNLVYYEIDPRADSAAVPVRNPLGEVRWWSFLRGDAYVNAFHDLLYALSRSTPRRRAPPTDRRRRVAFSPERLTITLLDGTEVVHSYADLLDLKLNLQTIVYGHQGLGTVLPSLTEMVLASPGGIRFCLTLRLGEYDFRKLIRFLYDHRVPFREFRDGIRSFRMQTNLPYDSVQKIKEEYGVRW